MTCTAVGCDATAETGQARCWIHQPATEEAAVSTTIPDLEIEAARPEPPRDRWGRYLIRPADGGKPRSYTRATTWAGAIDDKEGLINWSMRMCALGLAARHDLYAQVASCHADDRDTLKKLVEEAKEAGGGSTGANLGTALHRFTQRIDCGDEVLVPAQWKPDIDAYHRVLAEAQLEVVVAYVERIVVLEALGIAGTFDRIYRTSDGRLVIGDLKTGQSLDFSRLSIAVQLALYAHADSMYTWQTETHEPMPDVDKERALVVHVPVGKGEASVEEFDIAWGWERAQQAGLVRESRSAAKRRGVVSWPYKPGRWPGIVPAEPTSIADVLTDAVAELAAPTVTPGFRAVVTRRIAELTPEVAALLKQRWPEGVPGLKRDHVHTDVELQRILVALEAAEAETIAKLEPPAEGECASDEDVEGALAVVNRLDADVKSVLEGWAREAHAAGHSFNIKVIRSQRRLAIYRALIALAPLVEDDTDLCRATVAEIVADAAQPTVPLGAVIGALTIAEADQLAEMAMRVRSVEPALQYGLDGAVRWALPNSQTEEQEQTA